MGRRRMPRWAALSCIPSGLLLSLTLALSPISATYPFHLNCPLLPLSCVSFPSQGSALDLVPTQVRRLAATPAIEIMCFTELPRIFGKGVEVCAFCFHKVRSSPCCDVTCSWPDTSQSRLARQSLSAQNDSMNGLSICWLERLVDPNIWLN